MRPVYLKMKAFGSYVEEEIRFSDFENGLFLISGETGAGKTMIFDAIAFALFGEASSKDRDPAKMHCDRVNLSDNTEVKLIFSQNNQEYSIERCVHLAIKRGTKNQISKADMSATMTEPDGTVLTGHKDVTARCVEILGMNVDQFRKIVMLAQGEFREFLKAESDEKNKILGKLFDSTIFRRYQAMLGGARDVLAKQRSENQTKLKELIYGNFPEEERLRYDPENPDCIINLEKLVQEDEVKLDGLKEQKSKILKELEALNQIRGESQRINNDLKELESLNEHLNELSANETKINELDKTVKKVTTVLYTVKPNIDARDKAQNELNHAKADIEALKKTLGENGAKLNEAKNLVAGDESLKQQEQQLGKDIQNLEGQLQGYQDLSKRIAEKNNAQTAEEKARADRLKSEEQKQELIRQLESINRQLEELKNIDNEVSTLSDEATKAKDALNIFTGQNGIAQTIRAIKVHEAKLINERERLNALMKSALEAEENHHRLYKRFISGQAGLLADGLRNELKKNNEVRCPVCGSVHTIDDEQDFAVRSSDTPSETEVEEAKNAYDFAERNRKEQEANVQKFQDYLLQKKNEILRKADSLYPAASGAPACTWEQVSDNNFLINAEKELRNKAAVADKALNEAKLKQNQKNSLAKKQKDYEAKKLEIDGEIEKFKQEEHEQHIRLASAESAIETLTKTLTFNSIDEAKKKIADWKEQQKKFQALINEHLAAENNAQRLYDTVKGRLTEKEKEIPVLQTALETAKQKMIKSLQDSGFANVNEALAVLVQPAVGLRPAVDLRLNGQDGEKWIEDKKASINKYNNDCLNTREKIQKLSNDTADKKYTDLQALDKRISEMRESCQKADSEYNAGNNILMNHREVLSKAKRFKEALISTDSAWKRLNDLAELAIGHSEVGGKLSFERHVMGAVFREILEMANRRIDIMSGGKYELLHKIEAQHKNSKAGLEIEVFDTNIGRARPSSLLSGGEGFYASLALALGLSDVVQLHAGGKKLEALFIDEGFGTLSADVLDKALRVLDELSLGNRLVGIISHVDKLEESIPQKIRVFSGENGSRVSMEGARRSEE